MCYKGKCFYCIPIKKACLVLAIILAIANALLLLFCCYLWYRLNTYIPAEEPSTGLGIRIGGIEWGRRNKRNAIDDFVRPSGLFPEGRWIVMFIVTFVSVLNLIFSALLCNGILKRRPGHVNAYFIYGVPKTAIFIIGFIFYLIVGHDLTHGIVGLCGCALHLLFLVLVYQTRLELLKETMYDHIHLQEVDINTRPTRSPYIDVKC